MTSGIFLHGVPQYIMKQRRGDSDNRRLADTLLEGEVPCSLAALHISIGAQFTCFTSTKVQILTRSRCRLHVMLHVGSICLHTSAHVCSRMLTYAHVCSRMLAGCMTCSKSARFFVTYAHVCSRMLAGCMACSKSARLFLTASFILLPLLYVFLVRQHTSAYVSISQHTF